MRVQITENMWVDVDLSRAQREALDRGESVTINLFPSDDWSMEERKEKNRRWVDELFGDAEHSKLDREPVSVLGAMGFNPNVDPKKVAEQMKNYTQERYNYPTRATDLNYDFKGVDPEVVKLYMGGAAFDPVDKPSHYTEGRSIEPIDAIEDWDLDFNSGQVVKYLSRLGRKANALEDARKAEFYLKRLIAQLKLKKEEGEK